MEEQTDKKVYSYHTFLFPFRWDMNAVKGTAAKGTRAANDMNAFVKKLDVSQNGWTELKWNDGCFDEYRDRRIEYNEFEYFHENVRNAIYGTDSNDIMRNFSFRPKWIKEHSHSDKPILCIIKKGDDGWRLELNAIRLKIFNTGVGILIYELENYEHRSMEAVLKINEYGRRIDIPYVSSDYDNTCKLVADTIEITDIAMCNYADAINGFSKEKAKYDFFSPVITNVLGNNFTFNNEAGKVQCHVIGDDRMFVCCLVEDIPFIKEVTVWDDKKQKYAWEIECIEKPYWKQSKLYEFVFVDGTSITCINRNERLRLLKKHLYTRFAEYNLELEAEEHKDKDKYGTITAVTPHSMVCAINFPGEINPFLTMRIQSAILVLAQRASIIALCHEAAALAAAFDCNGKVSLKQVKDIRKLHEKYVAFQNQLLFLEATAQGQGVEMYKRLQESLYISQQEEKLERQLQNLHEIANLNGNRRLNRLLTWIAVIGGIIAVISLICDMWDFN